MMPEDSPTNTQTQERQRQNARALLSFQATGHQFLANAAHAGPRAEPRQSPGLRWYRNVVPGYFALSAARSRFPKPPAFRRPSRWGAGASVYGVMAARANSVDGCLRPSYDAVGLGCCGGGAGRG